MWMLSWVTYVYETVLRVLDTTLYYLMNCVLLVLSVADNVIEFSDKVTYNVLLTQKFIKHRMYENIN